MVSLRKLPAHLNRLSGIPVPFCAASAGAARGRIDVSGLEGLQRWLATLHNEHRFLYALVGVLTVLAAGALLGLLMEGVLSLLGRGTERIEHVE